MINYAISPTYLLLLFLTACSPIYPAPSLAQSTQLSLPTPVDVTQTPSLKQTNFPASPVPVSSPTGLIQSSPTIQPVPCDLAHPGKPIDITIPDGYRLQPKETFTKTWRLENRGSCTWTTQYAIVWFSGSDISLVRVIALPAPVKPGQSIDISVDMVAPPQPGWYQTNWKLRNPSGKFFGIGPTGEAPFWARIEVQDSVSVQATTSLSTATARPITHGDAVLTSTKGIDLDIGLPAPSRSEDLIINTAGIPASLSLSSGTRLVRLGLRPPTEADCRASPLSPEPQPITILTINTYYCYRTNQGNIGFFLINQVDFLQNTVKIEFTTWASTGF